MTNDTALLKQLLTPYDVGHTKVHIGPHYDGGYVISADCLELTDAVYSLGIGGECDFDLELAQRGLPIYQYEANGSSPPKAHSNFYFTRMFMNGTNFAKQVTKNNYSDGRLLLSMDIEGGEYDLLMGTDNSVLVKFNQLCFEIHQVLYNKTIIDVLNKLNSQFVLVHIHANNNCISPGAFSSGMKDGVPNVLELTYVHRSTVKIEPKVLSQSCPVLGLDYKNQPNLAEVSMNWWIK